MTRNHSAAAGAAFEWRRSSYSGNEHGSDCVEVAAAPGAVLVRDSKNLPGPRLALSPAAWSNFLTYATQD